MSCQGNKPPIALFIAGCAVVLCLLFPHARPGADGHPLDRFVLSDTDIPGFSIIRGPDHYGPESLWNYIDGGALPYLDYGVRDVVTYTVLWKPDSLEIVVDVYDMADSLGAFGIYSNERFPDYNYLAVGVEGYLTDNSLCFWKGPFYIKAFTREDSPSTTAPLESLAKALDNRITESGGMVAYFSFFPKEDRLAHTEAFTAKNVLGQDYLSRALSVNYKRGEEEYQLFLIMDKDSGTAGENFLKYREFIRQYGEMTGKTVSGWDESFIGKESWYGTLVFVRRGQFILGSAGLSDENLAQNYLETLSAGLPK